MSIRYTGIVYQADHHDIGKQEFNERELKVVLASKGCSNEKIATVIGKAKVLGRVKVHGLGTLRKKADIIKEATKIASILDERCSGLKKNLVKIAAEVEDAATVDSLLSINFINKENLSKFVSYKPVFEHVCDYLAELLLAGRIGLKDVPTSSVSRAIRALLETIEGLDRTAAALKTPSSKVV